MENKHTDLTYLREIAKGSTEFIAKLINSFITQTGTELTRLKNALGNNDWDEIYATAHKMKPSFHFVGIAELKEPIQNIENFARERKNLNEIPPLISKVVNVCESSIVELKQELDNLK